MTEKNNINEEIVESRLFVQHLENYKSKKKVIKIGERIEFKGIFNSFNADFDNLWKALVKDAAEERMAETRQEFREKIFLLIRESIYNVLYLGIKDLDAKKIDFDELNRGIGNDIKMIMQNLFSAFHLQHQITMNKIIPKKQVTKTREIEPEVKEKKEGIVLKDKPVKIIVESKFKPEDIKYYKKVLEALDGALEKGENQSIRKIVFDVARKEVGLSEKNELQDFYKRFINYKRKKIDKK
ncbi:MAG TPA: hypothetical protein VLB50_12730 [Ignavibacteriaceae bacterium]|nr:hypothetical protein [Ignavibacteriaceae bacterium]